MLFDQATLEQGIRLTATGIGTAFSLLLLLTIMIGTLGKFLGPHRKEAIDVSSPNLSPYSEIRDKALAAAIAVSTLLESIETVHPPSSDRS